MGTGGIGTGGTGTGGTGTGGTGTGGAGGANPCGEVPVCTINAVRCTAGVPQRCTADATGCAQWVNQTVCGPNQTCNNATGACVCNNSPQCGTPPVEGSFCPTPGAATFGQCTRDTNGCFTVTSTTMACTAPMTCTATGVVATGTPCGCPNDGTSLNTGCSTLALNATIASAADNAVLACQMVGACKVWRILVNCADQSLTAGTDAISNAPACVCKAAGSAPGSANAVYVDPDPPMAISMTNGPTGALQPAACRLRSLSAGLTFIGTGTNSATFSRVVAIHESSSNAHFPAETQPLAIPAGVTVTTADGPSFNTSHYTIDLAGAGGPRVSLANGANISGFTLLAAATGPTGANASGGANATVDILGCSSGASTADHLAIIGTGTQVGVAVRGNCALTGSLINVSGGGTGVNVTYSATTGAASFTGSSIVATVADRGLVVSATSSAAITSTPAVASGFTVTGTSGRGIDVTSGSATLASSGVTVSGASGIGVSLTGGTVGVTTSAIVVSGGVGARGIVNTAGAVTLNGSTVAVSGAIDGTARGILQDATPPATASVTATGGSITLSTASAAGAIGVDIIHGTATLSGVTTTVGGNTTGIRVQNGTALTVNGASVLTTSCKIVASDCDGAVRGIIGSISGDGLVVVPGVAQVGAVVTIGGTTQVSGFQDGISSGDGTLTVNGTVQVSGNTNDGIALGGLNGNTVTQVNITGATVSGNGNAGISVSTNIPTQVVTTTISGNQSDGVNVAQSQNTTTNGYQFLLSGSNVTGNGNAAALDGRGVFVSAANKVGVRLENNHISGNVLEGVRVQGRTAPLSPTEIVFNTNHINGNLTAVATAPVTIIGGGVFFASGAIKLGQFIGNRVFANSSNEIGFAVPQDISQGNPLAWDLSSDAPGVVDTATCADAAKPNYVYCYGATGQLGVAVTTPATIPIKIKGMHWANANPTGGVDFTSGIPEPTVLVPEPTAGVFASCTAAGAMGFCADIP